ncbi:hypothetical protein AZ09_10375 [Acetobacter aceti 1023]|nr:hypothetical protein AZ09_10375 [Acetobacter aceti 1023]
MIIPLFMNSCEAINMSYMQAITEDGPHLKRQQTPDAVEIFSISCVDSCRINLTIFPKVNEFFVGNVWKFHPRM